MNDLRISVVLATYHRAETLRRTLSHLIAQSLDPSTFEVIVIDDGSPDHTRQVVEEARSEARFEMLYLHHANRGPGYTQNRGLERARAPIVLLLADDIFLEPNALEAHLETHRRNPEREVAVLGRVLQSPQLDQSVFLRKWDAFRFRAFDGAGELPYYRFWACNVSAKRDFVLGVGGFREHRGRGGAPAHEDPELGYRLHLKGLRLLYCPDALGHHYHVVTLESACRRKYEAGLNFGEFRSHVPEAEIPVAYHVLNHRTLADHLRAWSGPRRALLEAADRKPLPALARHLGRMAVFNRAAVELVWLPLARTAERHPGLSPLMSPAIYRGILFHYFLRGNHDGDSRFPLMAVGQPS